MTKDNFSTVFHRGNINLVETARFLLAAILFIRALQFKINVLL